MFEKNMRYALLLDLYAPLLDAHTTDCMRAYYDDDLSLAEIAEGESISRQGIRHIVKKGEEQLDRFENALGLSELNGRLSEAVGLLKELSVSHPGLERNIREILGLLESKEG